MTSKSRLNNKALILALFTLGYNVVEGLIAVYFGISEESLSLLGFGLDSFVEVGSAGVVLLKLTSWDKAAGSTVETEKRATLLIGLLFVVLAIATFGGSIYRLLEQETPDTTLPGLIIALVSLSFMFFLWNSKRKVGQKLQSPTILADARCSLACIKLSAVLFIGSLVYMLYPELWWSDSAAAMILSFLFAHEGYEMISSTRKEDFSGGCGCH